MQKVKVFLQNGKQFEVEVENYDASALLQQINQMETVHVSIGNLIINKHHIEVLQPIEEAIIAE
jgi:sRNA-binding regulator protein Hfq